MLLGYDILLVDELKEGFVINKRCREMYESYKNMVFRGYLLLKGEIFT